MPHRRTKLRAVAVTLAGLALAGCGWNGESVRTTARSTERAAGAPDEAAASGEATPSEQDPGVASGEGPAYTDDPAGPGDPATVPPPPPTGPATTAPGPTTGPGAGLQGTGRRTAEVDSARFRGRIVVRTGGTEAAVVVMGAYDRPEKKARLRYDFSELAEATPEIEQAIGAVEIEMVRVGDSLYMKNPGLGDVFGTDDPWIEMPLDELGDSEAVDNGGLGTASIEQMVWLVEGVTEQRLVGQEQVAGLNGDVGDDPREEVGTLVLEFDGFGEGQAIEAPPEDQVTELDEFERQTRDKFHKVGDSICDPDVGEDC